jgi:hypothetical protein
MTTYSEIDGAVGDARSWYEAASAIKAAEQDLGFDLQAIVAGLEYHFPSRGSDESPFGPMWQMDGKRYPMRIVNMPPEVLESWINALMEVRNPLVRSRLADLLWVRKVQDAHKYARIACDEYDILVESCTDPLTAADSAARTLGLSLQMNNIDKASISAQKAVVRTRQLLQESEPSPGAILQLIETLASPSGRLGIKQSVTDLLRETATLFAGNSHIMSNIRELQISMYRDDPAKAKEFARLQVAEWIGEASGSTGLIRIADLNRAREVAASNGLSEELDHVRMLIEAASDEDLGLTEIASTIEISRSDIEQAEDYFLGDGNTPLFFARFGLYCPLPMEHSKTEEAVRAIMRESPIQFLATKIIVNEQGLPLKFIQSEADHFSYAVVQQQAMAIQFWLMLADGILRRALQSLDENLDAYQQCFDTSFIKNEVSAVFLRGFHLFRDGLYDECVCIVVPRLETVIREMARIVGIGIYADPQGDAPGGYKTLGSLLSSLQGRMPEHIRRYVQAAISDPMGLNLRNRICHGLLVQAGRSDAVLALHLATTLACLTGAPSTANAEEQPAER